MLRPHHQPLCLSVETLDLLTEAMCLTQAWKLVSPPLILSKRSTVLAGLSKKELESILWQTSQKVSVLIILQSLKHREGRSEGQCGRVLPQAVSLLLVSPGRPFQLLWPKTGVGDEPSIALGYSAVCQCLSASLTAGTAICCPRMVFVQHLGRVPKICPSTTSSP